MRFKKTYVRLMGETTVSTREEYDRYFEKFYRGRLSGSDYDFLVHNSKGSEEMMGLRDFHVEKSDSGNLIAQWAVKGNEIYIIGILSRDGRIGRDDLDDMREWLDRMVQALFEGKVIITSPNRISEMFVDRIGRTVEKYGRRMVKDQIAAEYDFKQGDPLFKWKSYKIYLKPA